MSKFPRALSPSSTFLLRATLRLRRSWTQWSLRQTLRRQRLEQWRLTLLLQVLDSQHLLLKELRQQEQRLWHRLQELEESRQFREHPDQVLPPTEVASERERLTKLLGL